MIVADTVRGVRTLETSHPPTYYFPPEDVEPAVLHSSDHRSLCEWKGWATYYDLEVAGGRAVAAAWSYPAPTVDLTLLKDHLAFYAAPFDLCTLDGEQVSPQRGDFYGGWVTSRERGPFKGGTGSRLW